MSNWLDLFDEQREKAIASFIDVPGDDSSWLELTQSIFGTHRWRIDSPRVLSCSVCSCRILAYSSGPIYATDVGLHLDIGLQRIRVMLHAGKQRLGVAEAAFVRTVSRPLHNLANGLFEGDVLLMCCDEVLVAGIHNV